MNEDDNSNDNDNNESNSNSNSSHLLYPYECVVEIVLPSSATMAFDLMRILSVDQEVGGRVVKTFDLLVADTDTDTDIAAADTGTTATGTGTTTDAAAKANATAANTLIVRFAATEAKMLRVSVSSFTEYLQVALKCYQEFGNSISISSGSISSSNNDIVT